MPLPKLSAREKNLAVITACAVIFYVVYQFLLVPKWDEIGRLKNQARDKRLELKIAEGKIKVLSALEARAGIGSEKIETSREEKMLEALKRLSQAISASGLKLNYIKPSPESKEEEPKFDLSLMGDYKSLYDFMLFLQKQRTMILVNKLDIKAEPESAALQIEMTLTVFY
jgi:Tfp pilus assembly protein PilO